MWLKFIRNKSYNINHPLYLSYIMVKKRGDYLWVKEWLVPHFARYPSLCGRRSFYNARKVGGLWREGEGTPARILLLAAFIARLNSYWLKTSHGHVNTGSLRIYHTVLVVMAERYLEKVIVKFIKIKLIWFSTCCVCWFIHKTRS